MNKEQLKQRKEQIEEQVNILRMIYDVVEVLDYKSGLIVCKTKNSDLRKIYKEGKELYSDLKISYASMNKYFTLLKVSRNYSKNSFKQLNKVTETIVLNKTTLEEIGIFEGNIRFEKVICNGKYIIAESLLHNNIYLFDINNNKLAFSATNGMTGLLEKVINKLGKGVFK